MLTQKLWDIALGEPEPGCPLVPVLSSRLSNLEITLSFIGNCQHLPEKEETNRETEILSDITEAVGTMSNLTRR